MNWNSVEFSNSDIAQMQQQAIWAAREMNRRAQRPAAESGRVSTGGTQQHPGEARSTAPSPGPHGSRTGISSAPGGWARGTTGTPSHSAGSFQNRPHGSPQPAQGNSEQPSQQPPSSARQPPQQAGSNGPFAGGGMLGGLGNMLGNVTDGIGSLLGMNQTEPSGEGTEPSPISKALEALHLDTERIILIILALVLLNEKADYTLILALVYLFF